MLCTSAPRALRCAASVSVCHVATWLSLRVVASWRRAPARFTSLDCCGSCQPVSAVDLAESAVEGAKRRVSCLAGDLHHEAVGEADSRVLPKLRHRRRDHF
jgi:hypothetical protein